MPLEPEQASGAVEALLTYRQAARILGVTARTVWTLVNRGQLRAVRFGGTVRIDPADLREFVERAKGPA
ncbi:MAG TPA: helix-turn-helix domain-containing protein [Phycisphaerae bacterium]|nr:helix-turn-helix domain-containing protein [Phycisphaerae bacterium]